MPPETTLDARFRASDLIRNLPPELLAEAEQVLRGMLTSNSQTEQRRLRFEETGRDIETTRTFYGNKVSVTDTIAPGAELETIDYSITVRASGEQRPGERHSENNRSGCCRSASRGSRAVELGNIEFLHLEHGLHYAPDAFLVLTSKQFIHSGGTNLP